MESLSRLLVDQYLSRRIRTWIDRKSSRKSRRDGRCGRREEELLLLAYYNFLDDDPELIATPHRYC